MEGVGDRSPGARLLRPRVLHATAGGVPLSLGGSIPELFAEQAARRPEATAIAGTEWRPTYAELDFSTNRLAAALVERSGGPAGRVAILLRHDAPLISAMLATLKAAGTAVVLNTGYPPARLEHIRREVEPRFVLTDAAFRGLALDAGFPASALVEIADRPPAESTPSPLIPSPDDVAFLIYTSGSTGRPKGVMQTHQNVAHNALRRLAGGLGLHDRDRIVLLASPSGGQGLSTVWSTLLSGATLCPFPSMERGVTGLPAWLAQHGVSVFIASASLFRHFVRTLDGASLSGIRLVRLGSDAVFATDFDSFRRHFREDCQFANTYSTSETGNITRQVLRAGDDPAAGRLAVGRPAEGMDVVLLDDDEIAVRSDYLSPGYWRDEPLTSRRYADGVFRTGDLGRIDEDGVLMWLGRKDSQVKVRGSRVDLLEVESALVARPAIAAAAVRPRPNARGDTTLTAYVALQAGAPPDAMGLRETLRETLPDHAVPTAFAFLDTVPMNPHGKVDHEALARIEPEAVDRRTTPATKETSSLTETEQLLADIWAAALERESVGPDDNFFALEGDSLTAAEVAAAVHARFGVEIELGAFAASPTIAQFAELVDRLKAGRDDSARAPLVRASREGPHPCSLIQQRTWEHSQTPEASGRYTLANGWRIRGPLDIGALQRSIDGVVARHEALRTTFANRGGEPFQVVHPPAQVELPLIEVESVAEADDLLRREAAVPFDLERGPLTRFLLLRLAEEEHRLLRVSHHINSDGRSWQMFGEELAALYEADRRGGPSPFDREPFQCADFATWEKRTLSPGSRRWRDDVDWWRSNLEGAPHQMPLPFERRVPDDRATIADGVAWVTLPTEASAKLEQLRREQGATYYMVRVAAYAAQLAVQGDLADLLIGTYTTTRRVAETRDIFGFFANPVALRLRFDGNPGFRDWLDQVRTAVIEMSARAEIPYEALCDELRAAGTTPPEIQTIFTVRDNTRVLRFAGLEMTQLTRVFGAMPWGFTLQPRLYPGVERCAVTFDARVHHPRAARSFVRGYGKVLEGVCGDPDRPLRKVVPGIPWRFRRGTAR